MFSVLKELLSIFSRDLKKIMSYLPQLPVLKTFGDFLGFNPHLHILASDGCFGESGMFYASPAHIDADKLEPLFRHKVLLI